MFNRDISFDELISDSHSVLCLTYDEYKAKQDEYKNKKAFKIDDTGVDTEFVFLGDDEILDVSIDYTTAKLFVRKYDLKTKIYKK